MSNCDELVRRIVESLEATRRQMERECKHPPCQHAQGIGLAIDRVTLIAELHADEANR